MDLREYLFRNEISITDFARKMDISRAYLSRIIWGHLHPGPKLIKKIRKATRRKVEYPIFRDKLDKI